MSNVVPLPVKASQFPHKSTHQVSLYLESVQLVVILFREYATNGEQPPVWLHEFASNLQSSRQDYLGSISYGQG